MGNLTFSAADLPHEGLLAAMLSSAGSASSRPIHTKTEPTPDAQGFQRVLIKSR